MVTLEAARSRRWMYVRASGHIDDSEDPPDITELAKEANRFGLTAILWDCRQVFGEVGLKQTLGNFYMLRHQLAGIRLAYVVSDNLQAPFGFLDRIAKMHGTPIRTFQSLMTAARWLGQESLGSEDHDTS